MSRRADLLRALVLRTLLLTGVWWAMVEGDGSVLHYGLVLVPLAVATSLALAAPQPSPGHPVRRLGAAAGLAGWFLWQSLRGGADVARRALARTPDLDEAETSYAWRTEDPRARLLVAGLSALMPGSLSVELGEDALRLHLLDRSMDVGSLLAELERRVTTALGEPVAWEDAGRPQ